jgi:hypothetical protein
MRKPRAKPNREILRGDAGKPSVGANFTICGRKRAGTIAERSAVPRRVCETVAN